jgi:hypothetical protein
LPDLSATPSTLTVYCASLARDDDGVSVAFRLVESGFTVAFTGVLPSLRSVKVGDAFGWVLSVVGSMALEKVAVTGWYQCSLWCR